MTEEIKDERKSTPQEEATEALNRITPALLKLKRELDAIGIAPGHWSIQLETYDAHSAMRANLGPAAMIQDPKVVGRAAIGGVEIRPPGVPIKQVAGALAEADRALAIGRRQLASAHGWIDRAKALTDGAI